MLDVGCEWSLFRIFESVLLISHNHCDASWMQICGGCCYNESCDSYFGVRSTYNSYNSHVGIILRSKIN